MSLVIDGGEGGRLSFPIPAQGEEPVLPACFYLSPTQNVGSSPSEYKTDRGRQGKERKHTHPS